MDAHYLKDTVGDALIEALNEVVEKQPTDPIEYVGLMLLKYLDNQCELSDEFKNLRRTRVKRVDSKKNELRDNSFANVNDCVDPGEIEATSDYKSLQKAGPNPVLESVEVKSENITTENEGGITVPVNKQRPDGSESEKIQEDTDTPEVSSTMESNQVEVQLNDNGEKEELIDQMNEPSGVVSSELEAQGKDVVEVHAKVDSVEKVEEQSEEPINRQGIEAESATETREDESSPPEESKE